MKFESWLELGRLDDLSRLDTAVHRLDARSKLLTTLLFIVTVISFPRYEISALTPFLLYPLCLAALAGVPCGMLAKRVGLVAPFALLMLVANPWLDSGRLTIWAGQQIPAGYFSFASGLLRFVLCVSSALILLAVTGMPQICAALSRLGMPNIFVMQLMFLHRYIFLLIAELLSIMRAVNLRLGSRRGLRFREYCSLLGHLLLRSLARATRVYQAMLARGFDGEIRPAVPMKLRTGDYLFLAGTAACFLLARNFNLAEYLGQFMLQLL